MQFILKPAQLKITLTNNNAHSLNYSIKRAQTKYIFFYTFIHTYSEHGDIWPHFYKSNFNTFVLLMKCFAFLL